MRKGLFVTGFFVCALALAMFYLIFFKLAPFVASTIPAGSWHAFASLIIYAVIGYFGGIGIPVVILIFGIYLMIVGGSE